MFWCPWKIRKMIYFTLISNSIIFFEKQQTLKIYKFFFLLSCWIFTSALVTSVFKRNQPDSNQLLSVLHVFLWRFPQPPVFWRRVSLLAWIHYVAQPSLTLEVLELFGCASTLSFSWRSFKKPTSLRNLWYVQDFVFRVRVSGLLENTNCILHFINTNWILYFLLQ
jgi:hypothetical protein